MADERHMYMIYVSNHNFNQGHVYIPALIKHMFVLMAKTKTAQFCLQMARSISVFINIHDTGISCPIVHSIVSSKYDIFF